MLMEKAYAKIHGTYAAIEGGYESQAMADLTGLTFCCLDITMIIHLFYTNECVFLL